MLSKTSTFANGYDGQSKGMYFFDNKIPKADSNHACVAVISLSSALKKHKIFVRNCF